MLLSEKYLISVQIFVERNLLNCCSVVPIGWWVCIYPSQSWLNVPCYNCVGLNSQLGQQAVSQSETKITSSTNQRPGNLGRDPSSAASCLTPHNISSSQNTIIEMLGSSLALTTVADIRKVSSLSGLYKLSQFAEEWGVAVKILTGKT